MRTPSIGVIYTVWLGASSDLLDLRRLTSESSNWRCTDTSTTIPMKIPTLKASSRMFTMTSFGTTTKNMKASWPFNWTTANDRNTGSWSKEKPHWTYSKNKNTIKSTFRSFKESRYILNKNRRVKSTNNCWSFTAIERSAKSLSNLSTNFSRSYVGVIAWNSLEIICMQAVQTKRIRL